MTPDQIIYDHVVRVCNDLGYDTYDFLPSYDVDYPFVIVGSVQITPIVTKQWLHGEIGLSLDIFGDGRDRRNISEMSHTLVKKIVERTNDRTYRLIFQRVDIEILQDSTTGTDLWHSRVYLPFRFY